MIPIVWENDPTESQHIKGRMATIQAENVVSSKLDNGLQDYILYLLLSQRNLTPWQLLLHGDIDTRTVVIEYYDSGVSGSSSEDGGGAVAVIKNPIKGTDPVEYVTATFSYNQDEDVDYVTITDGVETMKATFNYSAVTNNITGWTIEQVV